MTELFIFGGRTRLARELHLRATQAGLSTFVLCATAAERALLREHYPDDAIVADLPTSSGHIAIVMCALGLVHPASPDPERHLGAFIAECRYLSELVSAYDGNIHFVLVSTVIALLPPRERAYYAAFKNLAEATAAATSRTHPGSLFSVLYPGHLVDKRGGHGMSSRLATPYASLVLQLLKTIRSRKQIARVVGVDARLWLVARAFSLLASALRPGLPSTPTESRDGGPTQAVKNSVRR